MWGIPSADNEYLNLQRGVRMNGSGLCKARDNETVGRSYSDVKIRMHKVYGQRQSNPQHVKKLEENNVLAM